MACLRAVAIGDREAAREGVGPAQQRRSDEAGEA
ncbi:hypothetical protein J2751_002203 [Halorubrum alkaliphilum]|uniref:Uncharacterized protein n=1 Tax=Halorubrum alkaliphilum TaxID=261290 RepID=A0A8T4GJH8_9EURY|nr:hypothetical protein [Halorubrum alkaliphilum]